MKKLPLDVPLESYFLVELIVLSEACCEDLKEENFTCYSYWCRICLKIPQSRNFLRKTCMVQNGAFVMCIGVLFLNFNV